jgi:hypothetical protein
MDSSTSGNHAFLILAHQDQLMLRRIVNRISTMGRTFVHVDAKTDVAKWRLDDLPCEFIENRFRVYWGDWSIVEATVALLESALSDASMMRFTLISGSHYPIVSNATLERKARSVGNVIASRPAPNMPDGSRPEVEYERRFYRTLIPNGTWSKYKNALMNRLVYFHRPLDWKSVAPTTGMRAGAAYWSIERDFAEFCVERIRSSSPLMDYFKSSVCSDEKVFATLFGEFTGEVSQEGTTYSLWTTRPRRTGTYPAPITRSNLEEVMSRDMFWFARKLGTDDAEILDWLDSI